MHGEKIKTIRELRGFSQEYVADKLGIAQNTYSKIETGQTKLNVTVLSEIAELLGVSPLDIISNQPAIINFNGNTKSVENSHLSYFTVLIERIIESKDNEIRQLKEIISGLLKDKENMCEFFKRS